MFYGLTITFSYFSYWLMLIFVLWFIGFRKYINPLIPSIFLLYGFLLYLGIHILCFNLKYDIDFLIPFFLLHFIPIFYLSYINYSNKKYPYLAFGISFIIYNLFLMFSKQSPFDIYIFNPQITSWKSLYQRLNSKK